MITLSCWIFCACAALAGGFIDAIAGGGGLLTMPALMISGVPPHVALGTNKVSAFMGTTVSLYNYARNGMVRWHLVVCGLGFSLAGSWAGAMLAMRVDAAVLAKIIVILLPFAMLMTFLPPRKKAVPVAPESGLRFWIILPLVCVGVGFYDGFFGPGTGSFLILGLHWCLKLDLITASGTAKAFNLGSNFSGALSFIWHGAVHWPLGLLMSACLMLGNWLGSKFAIRVGPQAVRRFLVVSLMLLLGTLVWQYFLSPA